MFDKAELLAQRGQFCECGCGCFAHDAHHCLIPNLKRFSEYVNDERNIVLVRRFRHIIGSRRNKIMYPIHEILSKQILELQLREAADDVITNKYLTAAEINKLLIEAADAIRNRDKELWSINEELVKAGMKPYEFETFAKCIAALQERA